jgi:hypothetical protein
VPGRAISGNPDAVTSFIEPCLIFWLPFGCSILFHVSIHAAMAKECNKGGVDYGKIQSRGLWKPKYCYMDKARQHGQQLQYLVLLRRAIHCIRSLRVLHLFLSIYTMEVSFGNVNMIIKALHEFS